MVQPEDEIRSVWIWVDAQLSPAIARWIFEDFHVKAASLRSLGLRDANDLLIFQKAKVASAIILTKDIDLRKIQERLGQPPKLIHLTCGNTSNKAVREILKRHFPFILYCLVEKDEPYIEITD